MRVCQVCGKAERDPAWKLIFTADKPVIPGWYWYRENSTEADPIVVQVRPQDDAVGPWDDGRTTKLSIEKGEWAGPLEKPEK
jgi:hypothetical protein